ncbi:MAG: anhydro-N-acetylmuramic acid kinase [Gammaproteobacteria bacterium]
MSTLFIGLMSGTSMDAVDAALVDFSGAPPKLLATHSIGLNAELRAALRALGHGGTGELDRYAQLDAQVGELFAEAACGLLRKAAVTAVQIRAIGSHGQTVLHQPAGRYPYSLQIGNPALIAERTGITTVADFRRRDLAAGGQGAPLAPAFHNAVLRSSSDDRVVVNLGGIANITVLPADPRQSVLGFDTGPASTLMDAWTQQHLHKPMDEDGRWAASGSVVKPLLERLLSDPYFKLAPPKSTGFEYFNLAWLNHKLGKHGAAIPAQDVQATLCELTAASIAQAITEHAPDTRQVLLCGGGVHNQTLLQRLRVLLPTCQMDPTAIYGIEPDWVEAMAFAWLAKQTLEGKAGNLPSVTGAKRAVVLGGVYKGSK